MHDQTSVAHWSASPGICRLAAVAKEEDEEEWRLKSNQDIIIPQDSGRTNDCRYCVLSSQGVKKEAICAVNVGGTALSDITDQM